MTRGRRVRQALPHRVLQYAHLNDIVFLGDAYAGAEITQCFGRISAAAHSGYRRHTRVVPADDMPIIHEFCELAFARDGVGKVEPGKFDLSWSSRQSQVRNHPVVQRPMVFELKRTQRMRKYLPAHPKWDVRNRTSDKCTIRRRYVGVRFFESGTRSDPAYSYWALPYLFWHATNVRLRQIHPPSMRSNRSRFSATLRLRNGLSLPGSVSVPRYSLTSSALRLST